VNLEIVDTVWDILVDDKYNVMGKVCRAGEMLLFICFGIKLVMMFYFEKRPAGTMPNLLPLFLKTAILAALIFSSVYISVICEDMLIPMFNGATKVYEMEIITAKHSVGDLYRMIMRHEFDAVSFFNPKAWNANVTVLLFSSLLNITGVLMFVSLIVGPLYLFICLVGGPIIMGMSVLFGPKFLTKWFMMVVAAVFIQIFVGLAYLIMGDSLTKVVDLAEGWGGGSFDIGSALELALVMLLLCAVLVLAVPAIHGYVFGCGFMLVFPVVVGAFAAMFDGCMSFVSAAMFSMQSQKSEKAG